eukprot:Pgem_evm1s6665
MNPKPYKMYYNVLTFMCSTMIKSYTDIKQYQRALSFYDVACLHRLDKKWEILTSVLKCYACIIIGRLKIRAFLPFGMTI